jgi:(2Fe-2S) ferredoxin
MGPPYERHCFVCLHERPPDSPRAHCLGRGADAVLKALKAAAQAKGLEERVRVQKAGCMENCEQGVSVVVYPEGIWYGGVRPEDAPAIAEHLAGGPPVERLRLFRKQ